MTKKLLFVFDDYSEMIRLQTELMKIGFDIVGVVNEALLGDQLLIFNPDLVLSAGRGGKVSAVSVAQKLKENPRFHGKVLLLLPRTQRPSADELARIRMDALAELPCPMVKLIPVLARLLGLSAEQLMEKYRRVRMNEGASPEEMNQLKVQTDGASRMEKAMKGIEIDVRQTTFDRQKIREHQSDLAKEHDPRDLEKSDELRRQFAEALFKK